MTIRTNTEGVSRLLSVLFQLLIIFQMHGSIETYPKKYRLSICALFQNESFFLKEWLEYHRLIGVDHFYLYNNLSTDSYQETLQPYIEKGVVELFEWPVKTNNQREYLELLQLPIYNQTLKILKETSDWAAFIDLDEFIVPLLHNNLIESLEEYKKFAGLAINWQVFGTSGIDRLGTQDLIIEKLVWKAPIDHGLNQIVKFVVQPTFVKSIPNPHSFEFYQNSFAVNTNGIPLEPNQMGQIVVVDALCINHYWFGTVDWFINHKIPRREKWGLKIPDDQLEEILSIHNQVKSDEILKFVPELKKIILCK